MKKTAIVILLKATLITVPLVFGVQAAHNAVHHHTLTGKACWNESNKEMPTGLEMICGDKAKAVNRVGDWMPYTDAALDTTTTTEKTQWSEHRTSSQHLTHSAHAATAESSAPTSIRHHVPARSNQTITTTYRPMTEQDRKNFDRIPDDVNDEQYADPDHHEHIKDGAQ